MTQNTVFEYPTLSYSICEVEQWQYRVEADFDHRMDSPISLTIENGGQSRKCLLAMQLTDAQTLYAWYVQFSYPRKPESTGERQTTKRSRLHQGKYNMSRIELISSATLRLANLYQCVCYDNNALYPFSVQFLGIEACKAVFLLTNLLTYQKAKILIKRVHRLQSMEHAVALLSNSLGLSFILNQGLLNDYGFPVIGDESRDQILLFFDASGRERFCRLCAVSSIE